MNYYEHHIGDFLKKTAHLSAVEDGVYRRLLDRYYTTEAPLPVDVRECCKLARATSTTERAAVKSVLSEFFALQDDGHHQGRADEEIARFKDKQRKAKASADARWGNSERNANASPEHDARDMRTHSERNANGMHRAPVPSPQSPVTSIQTPRRGSSGESASAPAAKAAALQKPEGVDSQVWTDWLALRKAKKAPVTETVLRSAHDESVKAGMPLEAFLRIWCARGSQGLQADWLKPNERATAAQAPDARATRNAEAKRLLGIGTAPSPQGDFIDG